MSALSEKTASDLEWRRVLEAVAARTAGFLGRRAALELELAETADGARLAQRELREAIAVADDGTPIPVIASVDVRESLERLRVGGALLGSELVTLARLVHGARSLRRFLVSNRAKCPSLAEACSTDPSLDPVADEVAGSFDPDGSLADHASARLKELRGEYRASRERMMRRLDELMARYSDIVQDSFVTEREGRYVLPIRSDAHHRFPGIVLATSSSGGTIFVEPRAVVGMGNRLKMLEAEVAREEALVLARLSGLFSDVLPSLEFVCVAIARADLRAASARLARDLSLRLPDIVDDPRIDLVGARHLLLMLELGPERVVGSDLRVSAGRAVIVSGPNAGGKTVALKTLGLAALLVRAGLPVPCRDGSCVGFFGSVLTDVGDEQSLTKNLSTFSAHIQNLARVLGETHRGALVLLDEIATGTDPREGEALAAGVLDSLCARGGAVIATTHYEGLKALALGDARFDNASVGFDLATMTPTFSLTLGIPGRSSALAVARRFGLPSTVIERAERFLSSEDRTFEDVVRRANDERAALELARGAAETRLAEIEALRASLADELARARDRDLRAVSKEAEALMASVRRARDDLRSAQAKLRAGARDEGALREASRAVERVAATVAIGGELEPLIARAEPERPPIDTNAIRRGSRVYVPRLRAEAEVLERHGDDLRVAAGALKLTVRVHDVRGVEPPPGPAPRARREQGPASRDLEVPIQTSDNTVDVRGMRVDDALSMMVAFLDRCAGAALRTAFVIHGHGTGALRDAVRRDLAASSYVVRSRAGESGEGGDGVTVVWLR